MATPKVTPDEKLEVTKFQIESSLKALADAWNSHDMAEYAAEFTEDADFVNILGMHWRGRARIESQHAALHCTIFRNSQLRIVDVSLRPLGPGVILALVNWEMTGHETPPGAPFVEVRHGVITGVFVQDGERWRITAFHNTNTVPVSLPGEDK